MAYIPIGSGVQKGKRFNGKMTIPQVKAMQHPALRQAPGLLARSSRRIVVGPRQPSSWSG